MIGLPEIVESLEYKLKQLLRKMEMLEKADAENRLGFVEQEHLANYKERDRKKLIEITLEIPEKDICLIVTSVISGGFLQLCYLTVFNIAKEAWW